MKRIAALAIVAVFVVSCSDSFRPEPGAANFAISDGAHQDGEYPNNKHFYFLPPLVTSPNYDGQFNYFAQPTITVYELGEWTPGPDPDGPRIPPDAAPGCEYDGVRLHVPPSEIAVNVDTETFSYNWDTDGLTVGYDYRICVRQGSQELGYRDVRPDDGGANQSRNTRQDPTYEFQAGSSIPIKFRIEVGAGCQIGGDVEDCTQAIFGPNAFGTATCVDETCAFTTQENSLDNNFLFTIERVSCDVYDQDPSEYLDVLGIDLPQYGGCLRITAEGDVDFTGFNIPAVAEACPFTSLPEAQEENLQLHARFPVNPDPVNYPYGYVEALPSAVGALSCVFDAVPEGGSAAANLAWAVWRGFQKLVSPWFSPPPLAATHKGFGGSSLFGPGGATVSAFTMGAAAEQAASTPLPLPEIVLPDDTYLLAWALPARMERADGWVNPRYIAPGDTASPTVFVQDDPVSHGYDRSDPEHQPGPVEGARVWFQDPADSTMWIPSRTDQYGRASLDAVWSPAIPTDVLTAAAFGIGLTGAFADPAETVPLGVSSLDFETVSCNDYRNVLDTPGVDAEYGDWDYEIPLNISGAGDNAYLYILSDCYNMYFALKLQAPEDLQNTWRIVFVDEETYGAPLPNVQFEAIPVAGATDQDRSDDMWMIRRATKKDAEPEGTWLLEDWHVSDDCTGSSKQSECGAIDATQNLIGDWLGSDGTVYFDGTNTIFEFARCFEGTILPDESVCQDDPQDFPSPELGSFVAVGKYNVIQMGKGAQGNTEWPDFRLFQPIVIERQ